MAEMKPTLKTSMKRLVLAGGGHAHAQVLLDWARAPLPGVDLVVVSPQALAPYSGMVPGWLSGAYRFEEIVIDFPALCRAAGARWLQGELHALDPARRRLRLGSGEELGYDCLSLNIGSTLNPPAAPGTPLVSMRPLAQLRAVFEPLLERWSADASDRPFHVTAVGGGAAGFESLLAVMARLRALRPGRCVHGHLVTRGQALLPGLSGAARRAALQALHRAGATLQLDTGWDEAIAKNSDLVLWATGAEAHAWQRDAARRGALAVSERGFIRIDAQLRSVSHPQVFAVGDCAEWHAPLPKAGVYAVRMGPVLTHNLRAALGAGALQTYRPQHQFLALLATGDGSAIASRGWFGAQGRWAWRWKDHIDRRFVARFALPATPGSAPEGLQPINQPGESV
jgi:pyridine nucleotide-disulfide oxidoreductase family protein